MSTADYIIGIDGSEIKLIKITSELIDEMGGEIPSQLMRSSNIIIDYHWHKDKKRLTDAIRNESWVLETDLMRQFVALIVEGKYKPLKKGYKKKPALEKERKALAQFMYYRAMRLPIDDGSKLSCVALAAKDACVSEFTLINEYLNKRNRDDFFFLWTPITDGECIRTLNAGKPPKNLERIRELEQIKSNLSQDDEHDIFRYYLYSTYNDEERSRLDSDGQITKLETKIRNKYGIR